MSFYIALYYLIVIKFPDFFCRKKGYSGDKMSPGSPYGYTNRMMWVVICGGIWGTCMPASSSPGIRERPRPWPPRLHAGCSACQTGARVRTLDGHRALLEAAGADVSSLRLKRLRSIVDVVEVTF